MSAAIAPKIQDAVLVIEQLRIAGGVAPRVLAKKAGVLTIQYLEATQGKRQLSASQLESLTKALTTFTGGRA